MKLRFAFGLSLVAALALASSETPLDVAKQKTAEYVKAMKTKNLAHFEKGATADFVYIDMKGRKAGRAQAMAGIKQAFAMTIKTLDDKVVSAKKAEGGVVYVNDIKVVASGSMGGPKPSTMVSVMRVETLVVSKGGKWLYKRVKMLKNDTKIDGKPMPEM